MIQLGSERIYPRIFYIKLKNLPSSFVTPSVTSPINAIIQLRKDGGTPTFDQSVIKRWIIGSMVASTSVYRHGIFIILNVSSSNELNALEPLVNFENAELLKVCQFCENEDRSEYGTFAKTNLRKSDHKMLASLAFIKPK